MTHGVKVILASLLFATLSALGAFCLTVWGPDGAVTGPLVNAGTASQKIAAGQAERPTIPIDTAQSATGQQGGNGPTVAGALPVPYLGVEYLTITPEVAAYYGLSQESGVYVESVMPTSPAASAGILAGSIITRFDTVTLDANNDLLQLLLTHRPGDTAQLSVIAPNSSTEKQVNVVLGTRPAGP